MNGKTKKVPPSVDEWLREAKAHPMAARSGMFLVHNGVVRETPKAQVRQGIDDGSLVKGMEFGYDAAKVDGVITETYQMDGIFFVITLPLLSPKQDDPKGFVAPFRFDPPGNQPK